MTDLSPEVMRAIQRQAYGIKGPIGYAVYTDPQPEPESSPPNVISFAAKRTLRAMKRMGIL